MATRTENVRRSRAGYATKFGAGVLLLFLAIVGASVNTYFSLASQVSADARAQLLSGLLTIVLATFVLIMFVAAVLGREALSALTVLKERAQQIERGDLDVELQTNKTDEMGDLYRSFAAMRDALRERISRAERQNQRLQARADEYSQAMQAAAAGDLTARMEPDQEIDAMAQIAESFNGMMDELEGTVVETQVFATEVATAADELSQQAGRSKEGAKAVSAVAERIETGGIGQEIDAIGGDGTRAIEGDTAAEDALETVDAVDYHEEEEAVRETLETLARAGVRLQGVDQVTEFISKVAGETNMLALNASIEASKVDGGAEGFEVVADEIKSLAEETSASAEEIDAMMGEIRREMNKAVGEVAAQQETVMDDVADRTGDLRRSSQQLRDRLGQLNVSEDARRTVEPTGEVDEVIEIAADTTDD
jgi:methyl-accepting chemotaxis protein